MKTLTLANILIMENATNGIIIIIIIIITNNIIYKSFSFYWYAKGENVNKETEITVEQKIGKTNNDKFVNGVNSCLLSRLRKIIIWKL